jgi:hypothetical protein
MINCHFSPTVLISFRLNSFVCSSFRLPFIKGIDLNAKVEKAPNYAKSSQEFESATSKLPGPWQEPNTIAELIVLSQRRHIPGVDKLSQDVPED